MKRALNILWIVVLAAGLSLTGGCAVVSSEDVETSNMWAHYVIDHHPDDRVVAWAVFREGYELGRIVDLEGGDKIQCNGVNLIEYFDVITNYHWNRAEVPVDQYGTYDFTFIRPDEEVNTDLTTPAMPFITDTDPLTTVHPGDQITVYWDSTQPSHHVNFFLYGTCIKDIWDLDNTDSGEHTLSELQDSNPQNPTGCTITLELRRVSRGNVATEFEDGQTEGKRIDSVPFSYEQ